MKTLIAVTCIAILVLLGQQLWSRYQGDQFAKALEEITAREAAAGR